MKGDDIAARLLDLGVACLRLATTLETSTIGKHVARQLIRSSTSGGANYEEARSAESAADFAHKAAVAAKELGETAYWLKLTHRAQLVNSAELDPWVQEAGELVRILAASARTARSSALAKGTVPAAPSSSHRTDNRKQTTGNR